MPGSRKTAAKTSTPKRPSDDVLLTVTQVAEFLGVRIPTVYRHVKKRFLPLPVYATPKTPRWWRSEIVACLEKNRLEPGDAKLRVRAGVVAREAAKRVASRSVKEARPQT